MPEIALRQYENEIDHLIEEARYLEALAHTRHILRQHPRYIGAYYLLGKTMLEADQPELAIDMFQRALHADPEHLMARIGLMLAHQRVNNLDAAIWNLERAIELNPGDADLINELRQLYGQRDGFEPDRVPLNRAGLARLYMRGNRPGRAVEELRALLAENPQRLDLRLALAEAYWRDDQIVQAADTCQVLLDDARYCLKANLLLGALWIDSGQEEGQIYLNRAQEIDVENTLANEIFGAASPLKPREVSIEHLTYKLDTLDVDQQARWFQQLEAASVSVSIAALQPEMTETEARLVDITAGLEAQIEIPDWLRELGDEEDSALSWMADLGAEAGTAEAKAEPTAETQAPDWLHAGEAEEDSAAAELPDWLSAAKPTEAAPRGDFADLGLAEAADAAETIPDWLEELEPTAPAESTGGAPGADIPDWLQALEPAETAAEGIPLPTEGLPDWLSELKRPGEAAETAGVAPVEEGAPLGEVSDWLQNLQPTTPAEEEAKAVEEEELPDWMEDFAGVSETIGEDLSIEEGALPDWLTEFQTEEVAAAVTPTAEAQTAEAPIAEELAPETDIPDWLNEFQPVARPETEAAEITEDLLDWLDEIPTEETTFVAEETTFVAEEPSVVEMTPDTEIAAQPAEEAAPTSEEAPVDEGFFGWEAFGEEITEVEATQPIAEGDTENALLSGDDALAWLESLAAGKEDELRAQAEVETQARVAEILGHKPKTKAAPDTVIPEAVAQAEMVEEPASITEEALAGEDTFEWEALDEESAEGEAPPSEVAEGELDWETLAEQLEEVEGDIPAVAPVAEGEEALAWLDGLAADEMGALLAEPEAEVEVVAPEPFGEAPTAEDAPAGEGFFGWEAFGEEITEVAAPAAEGDFMSGDDALSWLESLAAGKEDELRAQAAVETQARVAEILGHKPEATPVTPEPAVEESPVTVEALPATEGFFGWEAFGEEITEVEATAPIFEEALSGDIEPISESVVESGAADDAQGAADDAQGAAEDVAETDMLSGDDALAWLSSLAAGKEDELRAQAEVETQARVAEILGRRPLAHTTEPAGAEPVAPPAEPEVDAASVDAASVDVTSVDVTSVTAENVDAEIPTAEGDMMSGDDALAWLSGLAAGKEDELRAQAEVETQARVAEILGRKVEPTPKPQVVEPEPSDEETRVEETVPPAESALLPGTAALSWLESFAEGREEELRAQAEAEAQVRVAEILGRKPESRVAETPAAEAPEVEPEVIFTEVEPGEETEYTGPLAEARAAWHAGDFDTALAHYNELILAETELDNVIADLQKALAAQPNNGALLQLLGDAYMANGMIDQAIDIFNQAMSLL